MPSIITASTASNTALNFSADTSGVLEIRTGSSPTTALTIDASQNATFANVINGNGSGITSINAANVSSGVLAQARGGTGTTTGYYGFKNRIINGAMTISQYNGTSSVTPTTDTYVIDRFKAVRSQNNLSFQQNAGSVTPPAGFTNYLGITATTGATIGGPDYWYLAQFIEGFNTADLNWGTANAKTVTLSFWVRASVTGSYSVGFHNNAEDRAYLTTYTISAANTWEYKTITLTGDTTGTWVGAGNGKGIGIFFNLGVGSVFGTSTTNSWIAGWNPGLTTGVQFAANAGATFYITGVQLEVGTTATSFDYRPYGTELALCQRYYQLRDSASGVANLSTSFTATVPFAVNMRANPTVGLTASLQVSDTYALDATQSSANIAIAAGNRVTTTAVNIVCANFSGMTVGRPFITNAGAGGSITLSAEL